jgi:hypothetical protein
MIERDIMKLRNPEGSEAADTDTSAEAVGRVRRYVEMRAAKPLRGVGECIHGVHTGTEWEAELLLSDLRALLAERDRLREALRDVAPALKDARDRFAKMGNAVCATALTIRLLTINAALGETGHD